MQSLLRFLFWLSLFATQPGTAAPLLGEAEFKAAGIFNILLFVQWPDGALPAEGTLRLCQIGTPIPNRELMGLSGRLVHKRQITVRHIEGATEETAQCDAIWVEAERIHALGRMAALARQRPLLLIGEGRDAIDRGAMISLSIEQGNARLRVDNVAAKESGITIGSRLLHLANGSRAP